MSRIEYKYLVEKKMMQKLRENILPHVDLDKYSDIREKKEYTVRSVYYDSLKFDFYHEKIEGIRKRKKVRIRGYNEYSNDSDVFLEIKRKDGPIISKFRSSIAFNNLNSLFETGDVKKYIKNSKSGPDTTGNGERFIFQIKNRGLVPAILISYEREAFFYKFNRDLRITLDKNLRSNIHISSDSLFNCDNSTAVLSNYFILEVKTRLNFPSWLNYIISSFELRKRALSKYTICLDSHIKRGYDLNRIIFPRKSIDSLKVRDREVA